MNDLVQLRNGAAVATIAARGAELREWTVDARPLIWIPQPAVWEDTAPILFPVVGWTRGGTIQVGGRTYPLGLHGFARTMRFTLVERDAASARFILRSSGETRSMYPFDFTLSVTYQLAEPSLRVALRVENIGAGDMPYACGLHPGFRWPFAGGRPADYAVLFAAEERASVPIISAEGLFTRDHRPVPFEGRKLALARPLFSREAFCFLDARSQRLSFLRHGGPAIVIDLEGFPHVALWSRPPGRFLSLEAWTGHGDYVDGGGDIRAKPSMIALASGAAREHAATYTYADSPS